MNPIVRSIAILVALFVTVGMRPVSAQDKTVVVFAAASMKNALDDVDAAFTRSTGTKVVASYAASSALMKQIEQGAPADVFISADLDWMDYGSQKQVINDATRVNLLGNRLVLIAPKDSKLGNVVIGPGFDLAQLAGDGRIATGDVRARFPSSQISVRRRPTSRASPALPWHICRRAPRAHHRSRCVRRPQVARDQSLD